MPSSPQTFLGLVYAATPLPSPSRKLKVPVMSSVTMVLMLHLQDWIENEYWISRLICFSQQGRKTDINLKSPGIKPTPQRNSTIGMGTLRKGSQVSMIAIPEEKEKEIITSPSTPTESTSPVQSPGYSDTGGSQLEPTCILQSWRKLVETSAEMAI